nr:VHS domain-containing protein At3g16270 [Ipomoea batatas]
MSHTELRIRFRRQIRRGSIDDQRWQHRRRHRPLKRNESWQCYHLQFSYRTILGMSSKEVDSFELECSEIGKQIHEEELEYVEEIHGYEPSFSLLKARADFAILIIDFAIGGIRERLYGEIIRVRVNALEVGFDLGIDGLVVGVKDPAVDLELGVEDLGGPVDLIEEFRIDCGEALRMYDDVYHVLREMATSWCSDKLESSLIAMLKVVGLVAVVVKSLIDVLFGFGTDLNTCEQKNDDLFADVFFHSSNGKEHEFDLFSGMPFDKPRSADILPNSCPNPGHIVSNDVFNSMPPSKISGSSTIPMKLAKSQVRAEGGRSMKHLLQCLVVVLLLSASSSEGGMRSYVVAGASSRRKIWGKVKV